MGGKCEQVCVYERNNMPAEPVSQQGACGEPITAWEGRILTLGLLRGLVDRPEDAPLIDRDLHTHTHTR